MDLSTSTGLVGRHAIGSASAGAASTAAASMGAAEARAQSGTKGTCSGVCKFLSGMVRRLALDKVTPRLREQGYMVHTPP